MDQDIDEQRIRLSREADGIKIEVWLNSEDDFSEGYRTLLRLSERVRVESVRFALGRLWTEQNGTATLTQELERAPHRVAVSLFMEWPSCKSNTEIQTETGLSQSYVSDILAGRRAGLGDWFERCEDGWTLSDSGMEGVMNIIVPELGISVQLEEGAR